MISPRSCAPIRLGRRIYDNLRKAMTYIFAVHMPIAGARAAAVALRACRSCSGPLHIAFLEMVIDPVCSMVFEAEPEERNVMRRPPRPVQARLLSRGLLVWGLVQGIAACVAVAAVFAIAGGAALPDGEMRSLAFVSLVLGNAGLILINRDFGASLAATFHPGNATMWILLAAVAALLLAVVGLEPARVLFQLAPLSIAQTALCLAGVIALVGTLEFLKPLLRRPDGGTRG